MGDEPITDYSLSLAQGAVAQNLDPSQIRVTSIIGNVDGSAPTLTEGRGFVDYVPVRSIAPYATVLLAFED